MILGNDEQIIKEETFQLAYAFWVKKKFTLTNKRIIFHKTNYIINTFGLFKIGTTELSMPLRKISDIYQNPKVIPLAILFHIAVILLSLFFLLADYAFIKFGVVYAFVNNRFIAGGILILLGLLFAALLLLILLAFVPNIFQYRTIIVTIEDEYGRPWSKFIYKYADKDKIESFTNEIYRALNKLD